MRVFLSSTVFDLIDVRAELDVLLRELGVSPVLSDDKLSFFDTTFDANSIETCLLNVEACDAVIVVLDQRYGPRLKKYGFDDVSATHLEYRHARKHSKPIYFYVRDRLEADYNIAHRNKTEPGLKFSWVKDTGLFEFLLEHRKLQSDDDTNNWFSLFTNSTDLKAAVRRHFEPVIKPQVLIEAIQQNQFPLFTCDMDADRITIGNIPSIQCNLCLTNVGQMPAFDFKSTWQMGDQKTESTDLVAPGQSVRPTLIYNMSSGAELNIRLHVEYRSAIGVTVREKYKVGCYIQGGMSPAMLSGATLLERTYHNAPPPSLELQDA